MFMLIEYTNSLCFKKKIKILFYSNFILIFLNLILFLNTLVDFSQILQKGRGIGARKPS